MFAVLWLAILGIAAGVYGLTRPDYINYSEDRHHPVCDCPRCVFERVHERQHDAA